MAKYIDADRLRAEIERLKETHEKNLKKPIERGRIGYAHGYVDCCDRILSFIDSLQQEQPEESIAKEAVQLVFEEKLTPFKDGNQWSFLLGPNIQEGICGFGDTILDAAIDFYKDYSTTRIHIGELKKTMEQPEVDLEQEMEKWRHTHFNGERDGHYSGEYLTRESQLDMARHFYELEQRKEKEKSK